MEQIPGLHNKSLKITERESIPGNRFRQAGNRFLFLKRFTNTGSECSHSLRDIDSSRRKIRLIEGNAKCRHLKKLACKGSLRQAFAEAQNPITPPPPHLHTVYVDTEPEFLNVNGAQE